MPTSTGHPQSASSAIGRAVRSALRAINESLGDVAYNVVFHSAPYRRDRCVPLARAHPALFDHRAGFELGTGVMINVVGPEKAAVDLREALARVEPDDSDGR